MTDLGPVPGLALASRLAPDLATVAAGFGHLLRAAGVPASPERSARFAAVVDLARPARVEELYWLARVTLLDQHDQVEDFDRVFRQLFGGITDVTSQRGDTAAPPPAHLRPGPRVHPRQGAPEAASGVPAPTGADSPEREVEREQAGRVLMTASVEERLRHKDFAQYTPEELAVLRRLTEELKVAAPRRRARRTERATTGRRLDLRRTLRRAHRTGGDPVRREYRRRRTQRRRVVLIADVSGSMESYSRVYLQLLQGAVRGAGAEAFVLATRLTRLTRALATGHPDVALAKAAEEAPDWSGGTRLGEALKTFVDDHGRRGMARGAVVVIVSDGWERADPALLGEQMSRLSRLAHRIVWVNPRSAAEQYQPLVGGMAAALPHVDIFVSGHTLAALDDVLAAIGA
ncbi:MAG TPA: VWA domain-containing protein [Nocardioidaceae bacterium]|nr:VWA domain-containing protein [Nocardioidaceae bacterium]